MTHLFFHVHRGAFVARDPEGMETPSLGDAHGEAVAAIRSILADDVLRGSIDLFGRVVITDEADEVVLTVPFAEAVKVAGGAN